MLGWGGGGYSFAFWGVVAWFLGGGGGDECLDVAMSFTKYEAWGRFRFAGTYIPFDVGFFIRKVFLREAGSLGVLRRKADCMHGWGT